VGTTPTVGRVRSWRMGRAIRAVGGGIGAAEGGARKRQALVRTWCERPERQAVEQDAVQIRRGGTESAQQQAAAGACGGCRGGVSRPRSSFRDWSWRSRFACLTMVFKLAQSAETSWRSMNGSNLPPEVIQGVRPHQTLTSSCAADTQNGVAMIVDETIHNG